MKTRKRGMEMADRSRLYISKLEEFKEWLAKDGWEIEEPKGQWEVLRARKSGRKEPLIVYTKMNAKEYLSVMDRDSGVIGAFLRDSKKPMTNADCIRAMSDEELAEFLHNFDSCRFCKRTEYECCTATDCNTYAVKVVKTWLQSESEE